MDKLTKKQLKRIAKMHIGAIIINTQPSLAFSDLSDEDIGYLDSYYEKIGLQILGHDPLLHDADDILKFIKNDNT